MTGSNKKFGFPKSARLLTPADFQSVFLKPIRSSSKYFTVLAKPNGLSKARLGMIVAKRNVPHAVDRNRIKRLIRESFRLTPHSMLGVDMVVILRFNIIEKKLEQKGLEMLNQQWKELASEADLWKKS